MRGPGSSLAGTFALIVFFLLNITASRAATCPAPALVLSLPLKHLPGDNRVLVPTMVNGVHEDFLLDTAGGGTSLTNTTANALRLHVLGADGGRLVDSNGNVSTRYVQLESLALGGMVSRNPQIMLTPEPKDGMPLSYAGVLAIDLMKTFDIEMDFAENQLKYLSSDHCEGQVVYWPAAAVGTLPFSIQDFAEQSRVAAQHQVVANPKLQDVLDRRDGSGLSGSYIRTKVAVDGKDLSATIDTGSMHSTMKASVAKSLFGVTPSSSGTEPVSPDVFRYSFHTLSFGGVVVTAPAFIVRPDLTGKNDAYDDYLTGSRLARADDKLGSDVTIGMDVLSRLHVYIAFKEKTLYFTAAGSSPGHSPDKN
jgi:predicted aspartyl protease